MENERHFRLAFFEGGELSVVDQRFDIGTGVTLTSREEVGRVEVNVVGEMKFLGPDVHNGEKIGRRGKIDVEMFVQSTGSKKRWIDQIGTRRRGNHHDIYEQTFIEAVPIVVVLPPRLSTPSNSVSN